MNLNLEKGGNKMKINITRLLELSERVKGVEQKGASAFGGISPEVTSSDRAYSFELEKANEKD